MTTVTKKNAKNKEKNIDQEKNGHDLTWIKLKTYKNEKIKMYYSIKQNVNQQIEEQTKRKRN